MKKLTIPWIIIVILVAVILVMAVVMMRDFTAVRLMFADNTPTADTPGPANDIEALRIIAPENHMQDIYWSFDRAPDKQKFYQEQLKALAYVGNHEIKAAIPQLILYLDYPTSFMEAATKDYAHGPETERARKVWPAFGALLSIPGSGEAVRDYCLDPVHPIRYRRAAFSALKFIDPILVEPCWKALRAEGIPGFQNAYNPSEHVHDIFWGMQSDEVPLDYGR